MEGNRPQAVVATLTVCLFRCWLVVSADRMLRNTHPRLKEVDEEYRDASIETLVTLLELDATSDSQSVTIERLRLEGINRGILKRVLDQLMAAGFVRRIEYRFRNPQNPRSLCQPTAPDLHGKPRYRLTGHFVTGQSDS